MVAAVAVAFDRLLDFNDNRSVLDALDAERRDSNTQIRNLNGCGSPYAAV